MHSMAIGINPNETQKKNRNKLINMEWDEINFDTKEWYIPTHKIKMTLSHIVPLSTQAIEIL